MESSSGFIAHNCSHCAGLEGIFLTLWDVHPVARCQFLAGIVDRAAHHEADAISRVVGVLSDLGIGWAAEINSCEGPLR